jgi:hypothetical protein
MKNKPQARIAQLTVVFLGILAFAGAANAARFENNFFDTSTAFSFGETFDSFNGTVGLDPNQAADRNFRNVTRTRFNEPARTSIKNFSSCNCYEAPAMDQTASKVMAFSAYLPADLAFNYSNQFNLAKSVDPSLQATADFNFGGTAKRLFNNATKFSSTNLDRIAPQKGLSGFKSGFENPLI